MTTTRRPLTAWRPWVECVARLPSASWVLLLLAMALAGVLQLSGILRSTDQRWHDTVLAESGPQAVPSNVVLVDIDEQSLALLGPWPWPRPVLAQMSERLRQAGASVQVWDMVLSHAAAGDAETAVRLAKPDVVFGQIPVTDPQVLTPPQEGELRRSWFDASGLPCSRTDPVRGHLGISASLPGVQVGHIAARVDPDGRLRRVPAVVCAANQPLPQLALAAAAAAQPRQAWEVLPAPLGFEGQVLRRGEWTFHIGDDGWLTVPYARPHRHWPVIRAGQLLDVATELPSLSGKVVLVGATALGLGDVVSTAREALAPGVSVHAELVAAALQPAVWPVRLAYPVLAVVFAAGCMGLVLLVVQAWAGPRRLLAAGVALMVVTLLLSGVGRLQGLLLPAMPVGLSLVVLCCALLAAHALRARREAQRLRTHLRSFMPPSLADRVLSHHQPGESLGEPRTGAILALRVTGIERWMARETPECALGLLHAVHASTQALATDRGGRVDHAQGHTLLVVWSHANTRDVRAALAVAHEAWNALVPVLRANEHPDRPLGLELALEVGDFWSGVVGSTESRRPVVLGAAVSDVLAMLEMHAELAAPILVGDKASALLRTDPVPPAPQADGAPALVPLGRFVLPGQVRPRQLHRADLPLQLA